MCIIFWLFWFSSGFILVSSGLKSQSNCWYTTFYLLFFFWQFYSYVHNFLVILVFFCFILVSSGLQSQSNCWYTTFYLLFFFWQFYSYVHNFLVILVFFWFHFGFFWFKIAVELLVYNFLVTFLFLAILFVCA